MSCAKTNNVRIEVESQYIPERSYPDDGEYFFAYHVTICNEGEEGIKLLGRHWTITDSNGIIEEGEGVIGEQPTIKPGDSFEYTSFCPLTTETGIMHGSYEMVTESGEYFDAMIAPFYLGEEENITFH